MNQALFKFIKNSPTAYHATANCAQLLQNMGYIALNESEDWALQEGKGYYVTRNGSSLIAFKVSKNARGFMLTASHSDSPCFKVKENAELKDGTHVRLSVEKYGGMLCAPWFDRPLSVAGRITVKTEKGFAVKLVDLEEPCAVIPNVAIHMNRTANDGTKYNPAVDMLPLYGYNEVSLREKVAIKASVNVADILSTDLFVYNPQDGVEWGEYISAPRLDDLQCAFAGVSSFIKSENEGSMPVFCLFDNEEVGSETKQGAASTFLFDTLKRVTRTLGKDGVAYRKMIANSFMLSCDNAHAVHPNHPEFKDANHAPVMNGGVVLKYNANQKYTTDAVSAALFDLVSQKAGVPYQKYANRADMPGGSTLGNISGTQVSLNCADIGLAQLAMHSCYETAGAKDTEFMFKTLKAFYETSVKVKGDEIELY